MSIKILNVMLGKNKGGLESVFVCHARLFKEIGYESFALCHKKSPYIKHLKDANIPYATITASKLNPYVWFCLIKTIKKFKPDVICLHGNRAIYFCTSKILKLFIHPFPKLIATTHNTRNKRFFKLDAMFAITQYLKDNLINHFQIPKEKVFLCPNAIPFPPSEPKYSIHTPVRLGFFARLHPVKGLDLLLKACQKLKEEKTPFELFIAGDGPFTKQYQTLTQEYGLSKDVHFLGWIDDKESFFDKIDILCMPSRSEGLPLTLLEGLAHGKPLIVSTCPGMIEVVNNNECALSFPIDDDKSLLNCLSQLIKNPDTCIKYSQNGYKLFLKSYNENVKKQNLIKGITFVSKSIKSEN